MNLFHLDDFIAGWIGGASSVVVGHPLDTVKVYGFFKGLSFPLASIALYNSIVFGFFSNAQRAISKFRYGNGEHPCSMLDLTLASMMTGFVSVGAGAPVDLVKIRLQMQSHRVLTKKLRLAGNVPLRSVEIQSERVYRGPIQCVANILQKEGLPGLYRGGGAMLLRDIPGYTLYFIPYKVFCDWLTPDNGAAPHPGSIWLAGGLAGSISWVTATPVDVVKSRMQADGLYPRKYQGIIHCIMHSYETEGLHVYRFFKGLSFPLASINLYNSLVFGFFSIEQSAIGKFRYGNGEHPCSMLDLTLVSMMIGFVSVGAGAPVDLVFFRGATVNAIRGFPMSATMFLTYELSLKFFRSF